MAMLAGRPRGRGDRLRRVTNGASGDLERVAQISRAMVHEWAMGTSISALQLSAEGGAVSDRTRELRDAEQQHLADEAMRRARRLLADHRPQLDELAGGLLRNEVLERQDIDAVMAGVRAARTRPRAACWWPRGGRQPEA